MAPGVCWGYLRLNKNIGDVSDFKVTIFTSTEDGNYL